MFAIVLWYFYALRILKGSSRPVPVAFSCNAAEGNSKRGRNSRVDLKPHERTIFRVLWYSFGFLSW